MCLLTFLQICGAIGMACAAWNLFGDLYFMDFYTAHLSDEEFGMIRNDFRPGYIFHLDDDKPWLALLAQAGGWMYPLWALVTAGPLYMGLQDEGVSCWRSVAPCALLAYGLCVVGGALHSAFAFLTVLPSVYHNPPESAIEWSDLKGRDSFSLFLEEAQTRVIQHIVVGCLPGFVACNVAALWVAVEVHFRHTHFPRWFNLFNPIVTTMWVQALGALVPDPWGFYFVGCLGTWGVLFLNLATTYCLWSDRKSVQWSKMEFPISQAMIICRTNIPNKTQNNPMETEVILSPAARHLRVLPN